VSWCEKQEHHDIIFNKGVLIMPLVKFDLIEGREEKEIKKLLDVAHEVIVKVLDVPEGDRYQIVTQHPAYEMVIEDTGLGFSRSRNVVVISVTSKQRTQEQKVKLYQMMVKELGEQCGIEPNDIMISLVANGDADWSFGFGEAQFLTGKL
jgi:hypothetical protein